MLPLAVATFAGTWTQLVWEPAGWTISPALRFDHYHLVPGKNFEALEPRLTVRRQLTDALALKGGAGLFHMPPTTLINVPAVSVGGIEYGLQQQLQFDVGAEWKAREGLELSADAYVNPLLRAVELDPFDLPGATPRAAPIEDGAAIVQIPEFNDPATHGLAYGFELMARHPIGQALVRVALVLVLELVAEGALRPRGDRRGGLGLRPLQLGAGARAQRRRSRTGSPATTRSGSSPT